MTTIFLWLSEALAQLQASPFAPQKCVNAAHFRGAKGDTSVWHAQSEAVGVVKLGTGI